MAVYSNLSGKGVRLNESHQNWGREVATITTYTTSGDKKLNELKLSADDTVILDAKSVTTVVYSLK